jgi:hypothetical protein
MRLIILFLLFPFFSFGQIVDTSGINWIETEHDFGDIPYNIPVSHTYKFVNNSKKNTEIISVEASCGCTEPNWTKNQILPNDTAFVKATFKANAEGTFKKQVTIYTDRNPFPTILILKGQVIKKD